MDTQQAQEDPAVSDIECMPPGLYYIPQQAVTGGRNKRTNKEIFELKNRSLLLISELGRKKIEFMKSDDGNSSMTAAMSCQ